MSSSLPVPIKMVGCIACFSRWSSAHRWTKYIYSRFQLCSKLSWCV